MDQLNEVDDTGRARRITQLTVYTEYEDHREMGIGAACPVCGDVMHDKTTIPNAAFGDPVAARFAAIIMGGDMVDLLKREFLKHLEEAHAIKP
jgi:hypothetical protein